MTSSIEKQIIAIHTLPKISRSKANQTMKFGHGGKVGPNLRPWTQGSPGSLRPLEPPRPLPTSRTQCDPKNLPGTTNIPQDVMRKKDFSGIIVRFLLYLRNCNFPQS